MRNGYNVLIRRYESEEYEGEGLYRKVIVFLTIVTVHYCTELLIPVIADIAAYFIFS